MNNNNLELAICGDLMVIVFHQKNKSKPSSMFKSACLREPYLNKYGGRKKCIFRCPLIGTCLPIMETNLKSFSSTSLNLGTLESLKTPKPQSMKNWQN